MWTFFSTEWLRFRGPAATLAAAHLAILAFMARIVDLGQQPLLVHWVFAATYGATGLLFGLYQIGSYRKPGHWLNLLHRPLPPARIAAALYAAGLVELLVVIALPILLVAAWQATMTARVVDVRHWLLPLAAWLVAGTAYLGGGLCALRGRRCAAAVLPLLGWPLFSAASGPGLLAVCALAFAWLAWLAIDAFRPDPDAPPRGFAAGTALVLPLQMGLYLLMLLGMFGLELLWVAQGSHPNNMPTPPPGGHTEIGKMDERARMLAALEGSTHPDAAQLREQVRLAQILSIGLQVGRIPQRNELANGVPMEFDDGGHDLRWVFSHDDMRLHGYRLSDRGAAGTLGVGSAGAAFDAVALPVGPLPGGAAADVALIGGDTLYQYVGERREVWPRIRLGGGERLLGLDRVGEGLGVLGDRALYVFDGRALADGLDLVPPRLRVALPGRIGDLLGLEMIELVDGYLLTFSFTAQAHGPTGAVPCQVTLRSHDDGRVETIHRRLLAFDYPALYRYRSVWLSPALYAVREAALDLFAPAQPLAATDPAPQPASVRALAAALSLLSLLLAVLRCRQLALAPAARIGWLGACAAFGLPALASLWLLLPPPEQPAPATASTPRPAKA